MKHRLNQKGYGFIEILLIIVALTIVGGTGYYVISQNKESPEVSENTIQKQYKNEKLEPVKEETKFFEFKELGVKIPMDETLEGLNYDKEEGHDFLFLSTNKLKDLIKSCGHLSDQTAHSYAFMSIGKENGQYKDRTDQIVRLVKQFPDFHISAGYPHGPTWDPQCKQTNEITKLIGVLQKETKASFDKARIIE